MHRVMITVLVAVAVLLPACSRDTADPPVPLSLPCQAWQAEYSVISQLADSRNRDRLERVWMRSQPEACPLPSGYIPAS